MQEETYQQKNIVVKIKKPNDEKLYVFDGFAVDATIRKQFGVDSPNATVIIYGLDLDTMYNLSWISFTDVHTVNASELFVYSGRRGAESLIFSGCICESDVDLNGSCPKLTITANSSIVGQNTEDPPLAIKRGEVVKLSDLVRKLAATCHLGFVDKGSTATVTDRYIEGDPIAKIGKLVNACGEFFIVEDSRVILWPRDYKFDQEVREVKSVSADNGMIGYPLVNVQGITVNSFHRNDLSMRDGVIKVESIYKRANREWILTSITHEISANNPNRQVWRTKLTGRWYKVGEESK